MWGGQSLDLPLTGDTERKQPPGSQPRETLPWEISQTHQRSSPQFSHFMKNEGEIPIPLVLWNPFIYNHRSEFIYNRSSYTHPTCSQPLGSSGNPDNAPRVFVPFCNWNLPLMTGFAEGFLPRRQKALFPFNQWSSPHRAAVVQQYRTKRFYLL